MMTNTFTPMVGGLEASIQSFTKEFRKQGHEVAIAAPTFAGMPQNEENVVRIPAIQHFSGTDFSVNLPIPGLFSRLMKIFKPNIIHSHHPFLMGDIALRLSRQYHVPLIFTHHIMFEQYIDYFPIHHETFKHFVVELSAGYANLADHVIVPSQSVWDVLKQRGISAPMDIIPTGVDFKNFSRGDKVQFRHKWKIPQDALVIGYVGRLTPEKNLRFLADVMARFVKETPQAHCLIVGQGPLLTEIENIFEHHKAAHRLCCAGVLHQQELIDSYHAMNIFAFGSHSETQGLVLLEAMAAGVPVVAVDAPAVRDFVRDFKNGRLVDKDSEKDFISALSWGAGLTKEELRRVNHHARETARNLSSQRCADRMLGLYQNLQALSIHNHRKENELWRSMMARLKIEIDLFKNMIEAGEIAVKKTLSKQNRHE
jgi:glycosyltransferase involved in cell wall biosynthesis